MNSNDFVLSIGSEAFFEGLNALDDIRAELAPGLSTGFRMAPVVDKAYSTYNVSTAVSGGDLPRVGAELAGIGAGVGFGALLKANAPAIQSLVASISGPKAAAVIVPTASVLLIGSTTVVVGSVTFSILNEVGDPIYPGDPTFSEQFYSNAIANNNYLGAFNWAFAAGDYQKASEFITKVEGIPPALQDEFNNQVLFPTLPSSPPLIGFGAEFQDNNPFPKTDLTSSPPSILDSGGSSPGVIGGDDDWSSDDGYGGSGGGSNPEGPEECDDEAGNEDYG